MTDYFITMDTGEQFLAHHGVKGMKWGKWNSETAARYSGSKAGKAVAGIKDKINNMSPETKQKIKTGAKVAAVGLGTAAAGAALGYRAYNNRGVSKTTFDIEGLVKRGTYKSKASERAEKAGRFVAEHPKTFEKINKGVDFVNKNATAIQGGAIAAGLAAGNIKYAYDKNHGKSQLEQHQEFRKNFNDRQQKKYNKKVAKTEKAADRYVENPNLINSMRLNSKINQETLYANPYNKQVERSKSLYGNYSALSAKTRDSKKAIQRDSADTARKRINDAIKRSDQPLTGKRGKKIKKRLSYEKYRLDMAQ